MKCKKEIFRSIIFILILIIIFIIINQIYISYIQKEKEIFRSEKNWQEYISNPQNKNIDYGFFGDSHTLNAINPKYIPNSYNFASSGEDYIETYYKIKKLISEDNIDIDVFILEIDPHTFSQTKDYKKYWFEPINYYSKYLSLKYISKYKEQTFFQTSILNYFPVIGNGREILNFLIKKPEITVIYKGFSENKGDFSKNKPEEMKQLAKKRIEQHFPNNTICKENLEYFINILKLLENKRIILLKYPITKNYKNEINHKMLNEYINLIKYIEKSYNIELIDYQNIYFEKNYFFANSDHLNYEGAKDLSEKLWTYLK